MSVISSNNQYRLLSEGAFGKGTSRSDMQGPPATCLCACRCCGTKNLSRNGGLRSLPSRGTLVREFSRSCRFHNMGTNHHSPQVREPPQVCGPVFRVLCLSGKNILTPT